MFITILFIEILDFIFFIPDVIALLSLSVLLASNIIERSKENKNKENLIERLALLINFFMVTFLGLIYFPFIFTVVLYVVICMCLKYPNNYKEIVTYIINTRNYIRERIKL